MNDGIGARPRLNWSSVADSGGDAPPRRPSDQGGFAFNLGNALAKLGLDPDEPVADRAMSSGVLDVFPPLQRREPTPEQRAPERRAPDQPADDAPGALAGLPLRQRPPAAPPSVPQPAETVPVEIPPAEIPPAVAGDLPPLQRRERSDAGAFNGPSSAPLPTVDEALPRRAGSAPVEPSVADRPVAHAPVEQAPSPLPARAPAQPIVEPAPADVDPVADPVSRSYVAPRRSVFDDVVSPSPQLPPTVVSRPASPAARQAPTAVIPPSSQVIQPSGASLGAAATATAPAAAPTAAAPTAAPVIPAATGPLLPTLPTVAAVPSPVITNPVDLLGNNQADIRALRSAQIRATRQRGTGRVVGRAFLVLLVIGGIVGAALMFGRDLLFPTSWDPALTPIVDEIERSRGGPFEHTVGLVQQADADFDVTVVRLTIGEEWASRVPEWRALGLATGEPTPASVAAAARDGRRAIYDPTADRIYMPDTATPDEAATDLRLALERAYDAQLGVTPVAEPVTRSLAGISSTPAIARHAVDRFLAERTAVTVAGWEATEGVPAPISYELLASGVLGGPLIDAAGIDPDAATLGADLTPALATLLDDAPSPAEAGALQVGEKSLAEPAALGNDDWSLVWGMRLPRETVDQLVTLVRADSYRPIDRNGVTCVVGVFETATAPEADIVLVDATNWIGASPLESQGTATRLSETRVQLVTCDPGPEIAPAPGSAAVVALVERQMARLAAI